MKVDVYFNLHRRLYSVRACEGPDKGRVIAHKNTVYLKDPEFKVSKAGRARVLREKRKNVHAVVRGEWSKDYSGIPKMSYNVTYNPYRTDTFEFYDDAGNLQPLQYAEAAFLCVNTCSRKVLKPTITN
tara:strand:+ start:1070 stop:1453 length:384 start_codon:yes stop_codon:yes gene_type:complete